jgi:O-antigen/teichoic acid export membrane protein
LSSSYRKNIISSLVAQYGNTLIGFGSSIFITRVLAGYGRGEMALYSNFVSLSVLLFGFSLSTSVVYFIASKAILPKRVLQLALSYFTFASFLLFLFILFLANIGKLDFLLPTTNQNISIYLICISGFFLNAINTVITGIFNGVKKIHIINRLSLLCNFATFLLLLLIYLTGFYISKNAFLIVVSVQLSFQLLQFVLLFYYLWYRARENELEYSPKVSFWNDLAKLFRFSFLIYATNLLAFFTYKLDVWVVNYYQGKVQLGIYSLAVSLAQMVWLLPNAIAFVNLSEVAGKSEQNRSLQLTVSSYKIAFYSTVLIALFFYIFCLLFIPVLYGAEFSGVPHYMLLLFIGVVPFAPATIVSSYLAGVNKFRHNFYASVVGVLLCIGLDFTLIPRMGISGACIASSVSYLSIFIYLTCYLKQIGGIQYKDLFHFTRNERQLLLSLLNKKLGRHEGGHFRWRNGNADLRGVSSAAKAND